MSYCTNCGTKLEEGVAHSCSAPVSSAIDTAIVKSLIRDPFASLSLNRESHLIYGVLGMVCSIVGFFLWGLMFVKSVTNVLQKGLGSIGFLFGEAVGMKSSYNGYVLLIGIVSLVVFLGAVMIVANWLGQQKKSLKATVTVLGATQWVFGIGFLIAGLLTFISFKFSIVILLIVLLSNLCVVHGVANSLFHIRDDRKASVAVLSIAAYLIVLLLISSLL